METHAPDPADRFTILREELRRRFDAHAPMHGIEGAVRALLFGLFMYLIDLAASLAEPKLAEQEPERIDPPEGLATSAEAGPDAGPRVAVSAAVAAPRAAPVIDDTTPEAHIREPSHLAAIVRPASALDDGNRIFHVRFTKTGLTMMQHCANFVTQSK